MEIYAKCIVPSCRRGRHDRGEFCLECGEIRDEMNLVQEGLRLDETAAAIERFWGHSQCPTLWNHAGEDQPRKKLIVTKFLASMKKSGQQSKVVRDGMQWGIGDGGDGGVYTRRKSGRWGKQGGDIILPDAETIQLQKILDRLKREGRV